MIVTEQNALSKIMRICNGQFVFSCAKIFAKNFLPKTVVSLRQHCTIDISCSMFALFTDFREDGTVLMELYQTLSCLAVRNEFCQEIMDLGGVKLMIETIAHNSQNQVRCHFSLLSSAYFSS